jgi:SnoaL-like domain
MSHDSTEAILALLAAYGERQDAADFEGVADLFTHGAFIVDGVSERRGRDEVLASKRHHDRVHEDGTLRTKHVVTNPIVDIDEAAGTATCRSSFTVYQATDTFPMQCIIAGRYHDTFHRIDGAWWFGDRVVRPDLVGDLSSHIDDDPLAARGAS